VADEALSGVYVAVRMSMPVGSAPAGMVMDAAPLLRVAVAEV
jgi:hypothetical protein